MSMTNTYRQRANQARQQIASLQKEKGNLSKKSADLQKKANSAGTAANRTKNISTRNSKLREAERARIDNASITNKIGTIDSKIGAENLKLQSAEKSLSLEEEKETKRRQRDTERLNRRSQQQMNTMDSQIKLNSTLHNEALSEIEKLKALPQNITVLFLAANPLDTGELRLDEEARSIHEMIRKSEYRDTMQLVSHWATRALDVLQAINECKPSIVHFSGHGSPTGELIFQNDSGAAAPVSTDAIVQLMRSFPDEIQLVFFNACFSHQQAEAVLYYVPAAIGMNSSIGDEAARVFASQFYSAIGFGKSLLAAFDQAKTALMLKNIPEEDTPELFVAEGVDPAQLVLVSPPDSS